MKKTIRGETLKGYKIAVKKYGVNKANAMNKNELMLLAYDGPKGKPGTIDYFAQKGWKTAVKKYGKKKATKMSIVDLAKIGYKKVKKT